MVYWKVTLDISNKIKLVHDAAEGDYSPLDTYPECGLSLSLLHFFPTTYLCRVFKELDYLQDMSKSSMSKSFKKMQSQ